MSSAPPSVRIVEVGPRDGLQNIRDPVDTTTKLELISRLRATGLQTIELTSVVSPRAIPQLADCRQVLQNPMIQQLLRTSDLRLPVLVPNLKGFQIAVQHGVREVAVFVSATEGFSRANINGTVEEGLARAKQVASAAVNANIAVRGYVSCIFADPYDGPTPTSSVLLCARTLLEAGCYEVSLGDTLGVGTPLEVRRLVTYLKDNDIPLEQLAGHFHDTYGGAAANVWEAYTCGVRVFDSSVAGLGGCPFAPGAKGNVASEDLVYMFQKSGVDTGVDLLKLAETGAWISERLTKSNSSRAGPALIVKHKLTQQSANATNLQWMVVGETEGLLLSRSGVNLKITLNRPKNGNALSAALTDELTTVIKNANADPSITRIILTGSGKSFCTGMNLAKGSTPVAQGGSTSDTQYDRLVNLLEAIDQSPKVTIACLNGPAFGGGVGLAFACDIRLAVKATTMTLSEVKLGLCPATISKYVIREWGIPLAREAMLSARSVTAAELKTRGLVMELAEDAEQLSMVLDGFLTRLKIASSAASRMSKDLVRLAWVHGGKDEQARGIKELFDEMMKPGADGSYGVNKFQAKHPVDWDAYHLQRSKARL
ncbi:hypothetical protein APSETT444_000016 [Aspergillus pseudonomiae]